MQLIRRRRLRARQPGCFGRRSPKSLSASLSQSSQALASSSDSPTFITHQSSRKPKQQQYMVSRNWSGTFRRGEGVLSRGVTASAPCGESCPLHRARGDRAASAIQRTLTAGWWTRKRPLILSRAGGFGCFHRRCVLTGSGRAVSSSHINNRADFVTMTLLMNVCLL